jgi:hypothetical protein
MNRFGRTSMTSAIILMCTANPIRAHIGLGSHSESDSCPLPKSAEARSRLFIIDGHTGGTITCPLLKGDIVQLRMPISPGTGFQWFPVHSDEAFNQVGMGALAPSESRLPGAVQTEILTFRVHKTGLHSLVLVYAADPAESSSSASRFVLYTTVPK